MIESRAPVSVVGFEKSVRDGDQGATVDIMHTPSDDIGIPSPRQESGASLRNAKR